MIGQDMHKQRIASIKDKKWLDSGGLIENLEYEHEVKGRLLHFVSNNLAQYRVGLKELSETVAKRVGRLQGAPAPAPLLSCSLEPPPSPFLKMCVCFVADELDGEEALFQRMSSPSPSPPTPPQAKLKAKQHRPQLRGRRRAPGGGHGRL